ncbi:ABC transporter substrate-binding protein [Demequina capsici]|uniref:ABC transporter substrate-binding protein n=1 Tax=Demequina capsici TaxID=3075620 RepID=A0AA96JFU6_9MICO|nr:MULTISPECIES: ABC transporter substrate-binding protein [unclassified Demequina]WNM24420.1 ABC transporter substrate-binding protein [Demequina sp. OYTSA14]WNM27254.1 ABC transporter substrate-binding protein [Demequina sp. PMTSA13]
MNHLAADGRRPRGARRLALAAIPAAAVLTIAACTPAGTGGTDTSGSASGSATDTIKIGYIAPATGVLAGFTDGDPYMLSYVRQQFADGITIDGKTYQVEILDRDSGSDAAKAGELAQDLITNEHVDLLMATSTPDTVNPVIAQCEANAVPCLTANAPWQAVIFGAGFGPDNPMKWSHHFFFGIEGFGNIDPLAWDQVETNKKVGVLWPNDSDGGAFRDPTTGYTPYAEAAGYTIVDPGAYEDGTQDFTSIIQTFKDNDVQIISGIPLPADFVTFWTQAAQQGFQPKVATIGKALFFPTTVPSIPDDLGQGLAFATWWGPTFPYTSSFDNLTPQQWIDNFQASPEGQGLVWNQATPLNLSLFEVAKAGLEAAGDPHDGAAVNAAFDSINMMTLGGQIDFTSGPFPGIATIPTAIGQWQLADDGSWEWVVVDAGDVPDLPVDRSLQELIWK